MFHKPFVWIITRLRRLSPIVLFALAGCTHLAVQDCPDGEVLGKEEVRLRTSHYRVILASPADAAARVLPYALMSAFAYRLGEGCKDAGNEIRVTDDRANELLDWLGKASGDSNKWKPEPSLGMKDVNDAGRVGCEDDTGLMFHVWQRKVEQQTYVAIAFRGTSGDNDWVYANLWWFTRFFLKDNQLTRSEAFAKAVIDHFDGQARANGEPPPRYVTTGHSLGGGLAQHVLYAYPEKIEQAIVFDPTSVTGFVGVPKESRAQACACDPRATPEARFIRAYQTHEILVNLRVFHKLAFAPERHIHELRFPFKTSWNPVAKHSMQDFATNLYMSSGDHVWNGSKQGWLASKTDASGVDICTGKMTGAQDASCKISVSLKDIDVCPQ